MRLLPFIFLAAGLASAESVEIRNRQDCYTLPATSTADCLGAIRAGHSYTGEKDASAPVAQVASQPLEQDRPEPRERKGKSLDERSVEAQESAARAQNNIATALWLQTALVLAGIVVTIVVAK